jgi:aspartate-semialdehyde dehydrogenase
MKSKIKIGILGCTGAVGQKLISLLYNHPMFEIAELAASENSAGKTFEKAVLWKEQIPIPSSVKSLIVKNCLPKFESKLLFSGLDSRVAGNIEMELAKYGYIIISNSKNHRMEESVPLIIPEVNSSHFGLIKSQKKKWNSEGFIVTNPNCSTIILAISLAPLYKKFGLKKIIVTTLQAVSGAGYPGVPSYDILGNVIPFIKDEEDKIEKETLKIFGKFKKNKITFADLKISALCNRVPVKNGHTLSVSVETEKKVPKEKILNSIVNFNKTNNNSLHSSPKNIIDFFEQFDRPQPMFDINNHNGMGITIGNIRKCNVLDWKFTVLGHNLIRGAAGTAVLNAEWLIKNNLTLQYLRNKFNINGAELK